MTIYLQLTRQFNTGRLRAILCGGQAVVLHRLAIMSKDGDWIVREDDEALEFVLRQLAARGARYRFGAPLDRRWLSGGWSSHFEFATERLRVRTDFFTRPPRLDAAALAALWREQEGRDPAFVGVRQLAELKKTDREKDYVVIGELARLLSDPEEQLLLSRSALDLIELGARHPELVAELKAQRPLLGQVERGRDALEVALDAERRTLMRANESRLRGYRRAGQALAQVWPHLATELAPMDLLAAHRRLVAEADRLLPTSVPEAAP